MDVATRETRRSQVANLLDRGLDEKLLHGGTAKAEQLLAEALEIASHPEPLPRPWPQLAAYRLAYLKMRTAGDAAAVREVLRLLDGADGGDWPDPLQYGFLCAVLLRLQSTAPAAQRGDLQRRIEGALAAMTRASATRDDRLAALKSDEGRFGSRQIEGVNIAELLTFAAGAPYRLEGLGRLPRSHIPDDGEDAFVLVGTHGIDPTVAMTLPFAREEFQVRSAEADIAFEWIDNPRITTGRGPDLNASFVRHLPDICRERPLDEILVATTLMRERIKIAKHLKRTRGLDLTHLEVIETRAKQQVFHPDVRVIGLVRWEHCRGNDGRRDRSIARPRV